HAADDLDQGVERSKGPVELGDDRIEILLDLGNDIGFFPCLQGIAILQVFGGVTFRDHDGGRLKQARVQGGDGVPGDIDILFEGYGDQDAPAKVRVGFADRGDIPDGEAVDLHCVGYFHAVDVVEKGIEFFGMLE